MQEQRHVFTGYCFSSSKRKLKAEGQTSSTQARTLPACLPTYRGAILQYCQSMRSGNLRKRVSPVAARRAHRT